MAVAPLTKEADDRLASLASALVNLPTGWCRKYSHLLRITVRSRLRRKSVETWAAVYPTCRCASNKKILLKATAARIMVSILPRVGAIPMLARVLRKKASKSFCCVAGTPGSMPLASGPSAIFSTGSNADSPMPSAMPESNNAMSISVVCQRYARKKLSISPMGRQLL